MDWSQGCVRNKPLSCHRDGFDKFVDLKLPDTTYSLVNESMGLKECSAKCLSNCSCMAYTNSDIGGSGSGCVMWFGDLVDIRQFPSGRQELYISGFRARYEIDFVIGTYFFHYALPSNLICNAYLLVSCHLAVV